MSGAESVKEKNRLKMPAKRQILILIPFSFLYALFIVLGDWEKAETKSGLQNLGSVLLWMLLSFVLLNLLCFVISQRQDIAAKIPFTAWIPMRKEREGKWYVFLIFFLICFIGYLPYFLMFYPTGLNNDAVWQVEQALGWTAPSNHHPWFHTMIIKFFFMTGYRIFGTYTEALAFYSFWQMTIMAAVYAFFLYQLYKRGTRILWLIPAAAFYAFLPINGLMSVCMTKDEFFTAALLIFAWQTAKMSEGGKHCIGYFIAGLFVCLLRSNGIFIFMGSAFFLMVSVWSGRPVSEKNLSSAEFIKTGTFRKSVCIAGILLCYFIYHGPVLKAMNVEPPDTIETLTMPTQHILCAYVKGGELTDEEVLMIDQVLPADQAASYYNPYLFDIVKGFIRDAGHQEVIAQQKWDYFKLWLHVGLRNPLRYLEAEVKQTAGYWAFDISDYQYVIEGSSMVDNPFGVTKQRKVFSYNSELAMQEFLARFQDTYNNVWSLGRSTWILLFCIAYAVYNRKKVMIFIPYIMLLVTLLLAAPVYHETRYIYGLFMALPVLLEYSIGRDEVISNEKMV